MEAPTGTVFVRSWTGRRVHLAPIGSAFCYCGHWLRGNVRRLEIPPEQVEQRHVCLSCWAEKVDEENAR